MSNHVRKKFKTDRFRDRGKIVNNSSDNYSPYKVKSNDSKLNLNLSLKTYLTRFLSLSHTFTINVFRDTKMGYKYFSLETTTTRIHLSPGRMRMIELALFSLNFHGIETSGTVFRQDCGQSRRCRSFLRNPSSLPRKALPSLERTC